MCASKPKGPKQKAPLTPAEAKRREMQREKQAAALAARAAGGEYTPSARKRKPLERRRELQRKAARAATRNATRRSAQKASKALRKSAPAVVVVPIFWKGQAGQMGSVLSVCTEAEQTLSGEGWSVELDAGHKYTPGQKFAYWEHRGVRLRVEVGPQEAARHCCTLALTRAPGVPAERINGGAVDASLPARLSEVSEQMRAEVGEMEVGEMEEASRKTDGAEGEIDERAGDEEAPQLQQESVHRHGGDDLEDDFDIKPSEEAKPKEKARAKKRKGYDTSGLTTQESARKLKPATKRKIVKF
ncbi:MAG: hypothetical protein SGPRY_008085 [Prymnesium sp.]